MELNRQPIGIAGPSFVVRPHSERAVYGVRLTDSWRTWREQFNREAPKAPGVAIHVRRDLVRFEATPANFSCGFRKF